MHTHLLMAQRSEVINKTDFKVVGFVLFAYFIDFVEGKYGTYIIYFEVLIFFFGIFRQIFSFYYFCIVK